VGGGDRIRTGSTRYELSDKWPIRYGHTLTAQVILKLEAALRCMVTDMIPQDLSDVIWAYSKFALRPMSETFDVLEQVTEGLILEMIPQAVSNTIYGYAVPQAPPARQKTFNHHM